jgi:hypothetical protein
VHVLKRVHGWLRPRGRLLDIHPEPQRASIDIHTPGGMTHVGAFERPALDDKIRAARAGLISLLEVGLYRYECSTTFEVVSHHASVDAWLEYRASRNSTSPVDPMLLERAREMLSTLGGDELLVREQIRATCYCRRGH